MKLSTGDRVAFQDQNKIYVKARVTYSKNKVIRLVSTDGRRFTNSKKEDSRGEKISTSQIKKIPFGLFTFDTALDNDIYSGRQSANYWQALCQVNYWTFGSERVHSIDDLKYFLTKKEIKQPVIIFNGHGSTDGFLLTNGEVFIPTRDFEIHPKNKNKIVIFSSCLIGKDPDLCQKYKAFFEAEAVFAYKTEIYDFFCPIVENILLLLIENFVSPEVARKNVASLLKPIKNLNQKNSKKFPLEIY